MDGPEFLERLALLEIEAAATRQRHIDRYQRRMRWQGRFRALGASLTPIGVWLLLAYTVAMNMCGCAAARPKPAPNTATRNAVAQLRAAVQIEVYCFWGDPPTIDVSYYNASGVLVSDHDVLTAYHVIHCGEHPGGAALIRAILSTGAVSHAEVVAMDPKHDLARIALTDRAAFADKPPVVARAHTGARLCIAAAFPARGIRCGVVNGIYEDGTSWGEIHHMAPTVVGNSGSGVYDLQGNLVGIVNSRPRLCAIPDEFIMEGFTCGGRASLLWGRGVWP